MSESSHKKEASIATLTLRSASRDDIQRGAVLRRCLAIAGALVRQGHTIQDLATHHQVHQRTIYRDLMALEAVGIPVHTERRGSRTTHHVNPQDLRAVLGV